MSEDDPAEDFLSIVLEYTSPTDQSYVTGGPLALADQSKADRYIKQAKDKPLRLFVHDAKSVHDAYALAYRVIRDDGDNVLHFTGQSFVNLTRRSISDNLISGNIHLLSRLGTILISDLDMHGASDWEWSVVGGFIVNFQADNRPGPEGHRKLYILTDTEILTQMEFRSRMAYMRLTNGHNGIVYPYGVA